MKEVSTMENTIKKRYYYLDYLRILAILVVIFNHMCTTVWSTLPVESTDWKIVNFYCGLTRYPMGILMMVTGSTFGDPGKKVTLDKLFKKNILKMATCFVFWTIFLVLIAPLIDQLLLKRPVNWEEVPSLLVLGPYHLWYQYMIIGIYLIVPFLRKITEDENLTKYYLALSFVFTLLLPNIQMLLGESLLDGVILKITFHFTLGYAPFFVLGYYLHSHDIRGKKEYLLYALSILSFAVTLISSFVISAKTGTPTGYYDSFCMFVVLSEPGLFLFFKNHVGNIPLSVRAQKILSSVSAYSFGVYLMHYYVFTRLQLIGFSPLMISPLIGIPACTIAIFVVSYFITALLKKIPFIKDYAC